MKSHQIKRFVVLDEKDSEEYWGLSTMILVKGIQEYAAIIERAFPNLSFDGPYPNDTADFDWFIVCDATDEQQAAIRSLLNVLSTAFLVKDSLDECFALALHTVLTETGAFQRTPLGQMVREAKPYDSGWNVGSKRQAEELAAKMTDFIRIHPAYCRVPLIAAVPPSNSDKPFDLPTFLVERVAASTGKEIVSQYIQKVRATDPMKNSATLAEKVANVKDAFQADGTKLTGQDVILLDDIYHTGTSINEVGRSIKAAGAHRVFGLTITKTIRSL